MITREDNHNAMHWMEEGTCAPICEESEYLDPWDFSCRRSSDPGEHCEGEWDSFVCSSGLCGQSACCDASAAQKDAGGWCCTVCSESDGACLARGRCPWWMQQYDAYGNFENEIVFTSLQDLKDAVASCSDPCLEASAWDVGLLTSFREAFKDVHGFNGDISGWDVSNATDMSYMLSLIHI